MSYSSIKDLICNNPNRPLIMGILNCTTDSFSDGGQFIEHSDAITRAHTMVSEGADIIDIGGESTRPFAEPVSESEELDRVIPLIEKLSSELSAPISIDTYKPAVMKAAVEAGAAMINDVRALNTEHAAETAALLDVPVCLMHMQGTPENMQQEPHYNDVIEDISTFLMQAMNRAIDHGIRKEHIILDPGFGFGKTLDHNLTLLKNLDQFQQFDVPLLVGLSRKRMIGDLLDVPADERVFGSVSAALIAVQSGAKIIRVHDVKPTTQVMSIYNAVNQHPSE